MWLLRKKRNHCSGAEPLCRCSISELGSKVIESKLKAWMFHVQILPCHEFTVGPWACYCILALVSNVQRKGMHMNLEFSKRYIKCCSIHAVLSIFTFWNNYLFECLPCLT